MEINIDQYKAAIDDAVSVRELFRKQNDFILEMFNDKRIPNGVKLEYADRYNKLKIKSEKEQV